LKYFLSFRNFEQLGLALKTEFALNFSNRGVATLPAPRFVRHWELGTTKDVSDLGLLRSVMIKKKWFTELFHINSTPKVINEKCSDTFIK